MATVVPMFDGKPEDFRGWIKAIEKYVVLTGLERQDGKPLPTKEVQGW